MNEDRTDQPDDDEEPAPSGDEAEAAGREAAAIGGRAGDENLPPALRPVVEGGEGVAEGFELAEQDLIEATQHGASSADPIEDAFTPEREGDHPVGEYGEADQEQSSEVPDSDR